MKNQKTHLYNVAHPLAESGKPIFIPFGEWNYDGQHRQRLDRAHGERIANELNARVAKGDPGIPVYQGHPDVPALASKYPDKGALGWITRIEIVNEDLRLKNEDSSSGGPNANLQSSILNPQFKGGLALTVEWDRDPGRGFRWFSPYWLANSREGGTYIVDEIASIGLVNNPNIPEFRLANEGQPMKKKLNPAIIELAARYDRLANEWNESDHPRDEQGQFTDKGASEMSSESLRSSLADQFKKSRKNASVVDPNTELAQARAQYKHEKDTQRALRASGKQENAEWAKSYKQRKIDSMAYIQSIHKAAILAGFKYNAATRSYE